MRQLETKLGVSLLARSSRSVAPTAADERLLREAGPAVDLALESLKAVTTKNGATRGRLRLTVPMIAVSHLTHYARNPRRARRKRATTGAVAVCIRGSDPWTLPALCVRRPPRGVASDQLLTGSPTRVGMKLA